MWETRGMIERSKRGGRKVGRGKYRVKSLDGKKNTREV